MTTTAIVGGGGFIGTRLAKTLRASGYEVVVIDVDGAFSTDCTFRLADVCNLQSVRRALAGVDVVYNLAAVHRDNIRPIARYDEVNVTGAVNVCQACRDLRIERIVFTSSVAVYGSSVPDADESTATAATSAYGRSKLLAEGVHRDWQAEAPSSRSLVTVRPSVVFGEGNRGNVYELVRQIATGRFVMVGDGLNSKSMAYVGNLSAFLVHILKLDRGVHLFNYADKPDFTMQRFVDTIALALEREIVGVRIPFAAAYAGGILCDWVSAITGRKFPISAIRVKKFCSTTTYSIRKVNSVGFRPPFSMYDALLRTIKYENKLSFLD